MFESTRKSSKLNVLQHVDTAFTKCHIVSAAFSKIQYDDLFTFPFLPIITDSVLYI